MATTTTTKQRNIKHLARDFETLKRDMIEHIRVYFPDNFSDFNESGIGLMLVENEQCPRCRGTGKRGPEVTP